MEEQGVRILLHSADGEPVWIPEERLWTWQTAQSEHKRFSGSRQSGSSELRRKLICALREALCKADGT